MRRIIICDKKWVYYQNYYLKTVASSWLACRNDHEGIIHLGFITGELAVNVGGSLFSANRMKFEVMLRIKIY